MDQLKKQFLGNSLSTWVLIGSIVLVVIAGNAYLAITTIKELSTVQRNLYTTSQNTLILSDLHLSVISAETGQRGFLLTDDEGYLRPYKRVLAKLDEQLEKLYSVQLNQDHGRSKLNNLIVLIRQKMDELERTVNLGLKDRNNQALNIVMTGLGRDLYHQIFQVFSALKANEIQRRDELYVELKKIQKESTVIFMISGTTSALLLIGMMVLARLNLNNEDKLRVSLEQQNERLTEEVATRTQELVLYSDELSRSNRELEDFAFVASHDLQEPLRKIRAFGDRLQSNYAAQLEGKGADYINRMQTAAERMSNLINDLLEFSRITTRGKDFAPVDLDSLLDEIVGHLEVAIDESNTQIERPTLPKIIGDEGQLYQLFLNLLSNAIKFRKLDSSPEIVMTYQKTERKDLITQEQVFNHEFVISDNGIGFEQEFADKIFVPFQRLHGRSEYKGTGIGLAVCRRIVERHGGKIRASSELGKGAKFVVTIPVDASIFNQDEN